MRIENDKLLHILVSFGLFMSFHFFLGMGIILSANLTLLIGLLKEFWDIRGTGFSPKDLLADLVGISIPLIIALILNK